uniref:PRKCA-binding protein n=1 Tax=Steinernema glaseri TaxID=37863 RepID=A0A1I7YQ49_9BILA
MEEVRISNDVAVIQKDANGHVGISIGGGEPFCPCVYVVQVFEGSPTALDGRLRPGDEICAINGRCVRGEKKTTVAKLILQIRGDVKISFNRLDGDLEQGLSLDIVLKKAKHRLVESMTSETADALGLSRAILCKDLLVQKMKVLERNAALHQKIIEQARALYKLYSNMSLTQKTFGDILCEMASREANAAASASFNRFGEFHRNLHRIQQSMLAHLDTIIKDLSTYVDKAVPDTKLTVKKYLDVKFEYLSFCLKLKEMDDEEIQFGEMGETLYRVSTGNYEYRVMLRCREESKAKFVRLRTDVMEKIELLDQKHVRDIALQFGNFVERMRAAFAECQEHLQGSLMEIPIEVDLQQVTVKYNPSGRLEEAEEDEPAAVEEAKEPEATPERTEEPDLLIDF